jgi:PAS domain S-box-containing protein
MEPDATQRDMLRVLEELLVQRKDAMRDGLAVYDRGGVAEVRVVGNQARIRAPDRALLAALANAKRAREGLLGARILEDTAKLWRLRLLLAVFFVTSLCVLLAFYLRARRSSLQQALAQAEVSRQRQLADSIIENAPLGVFLKETDRFTLLRVNRQIEDLAGRPREDMLGKDDSQFVGPVPGQLLIQGERDLVQRRQMQSIEEVEIQTTRGRRTLLVRKVLIPDDSGRIGYLLGLAEDVTDRRRAESAQREFAETLERKSRELEAANKELESFSYSVSHDLRAPLRAVEGYATILQEDYGAALDDEGRRYLNNIREGATRMGHLIQDLLAFSRLSRQPISPVETDTRMLVQTAWQAIRAAQPQLRAELVVQDLPATWGDARLLQQVWINLLENAVKYSSKADAPRIDVSGGRAEGNEALFQIQDNGVGFDMRYYDKLFNVFQRLHSESEYSGTGVGLAIVQRVIARHGGRVWARSEPGKGATFSFALPFGPGA